MLNMDFSQRVVIDTNLQKWVTSPAMGVLRKPLARAEQERGHATSIVQYQEGAKFKQHSHPLGEEILVLDGVFSDETGDYQAGTYFRNPPGSHHAPFSASGCIILVKLHQFDTKDKASVLIDTHKMNSEIIHTGVRYQLLHQFEMEQVAIVELAAGHAFVPEITTTARGMEILVLEGEVDQQGQRLKAMTWLRSPIVSNITAVSQPTAKIWIKTGHL